MYAPLPDHDLLYRTPKHVLEMVACCVRRGPSWPNRFSRLAPNYHLKVETSEAPAVSLDEWTKYCEDTLATKRRPTRTVWAGKVPIGSEHRIARQTMTTTNTNDIDATVAQARIDGI